MQKMQNRKTIARPYAEAILELSNSEECEKWFLILKALALITRNEQLIHLSKDPLFDNNELTNFIINIVETYISLSQRDNLKKQQLNIPFNSFFYGRVKNLIHVLVSFRRLEIVPEILDHFSDLMDLRKKLSRVEIRTAFLLTESQTDELIAFLKKKLGKTVSAQIILDRNLIGGVKILVDGMIFNFSIKQRLKKLEFNLLK